MAAAGAADEAQEQAAQGVLAGVVLGGVGPGFGGRPALGENVGMGQRLVEPLPPAAGADVEPKLDRRRAVAEEKGVGRRQEDGVFGLRQPGT